MTLRDVDILQSGPLSPGIQVVEASAGTGKTYQIANLVLRLVAEDGVQMAEVLVVTFTNAAAAELRDRIRARLAQGAEALRRGESGDEYLAGLTARAGAERDTWLERLERAQEAFDQATISTIHGFCQRMLQQHAFESGTEFGLELLADDSEVLEELCDDYLSLRVNMAPAEEYAFLVDQCEFCRDELLAVARAALADPEMALDPPASTEPPPGWQKELEALAEAWDDAEDELAARFEAGKPTKPNIKKNPEAILFKSNREGTYVGKKVRAQGEALRQWIHGSLAEGGYLTVPEALLGWFDPTALQERLLEDADFDASLLERVSEGLEQAAPVAVARQANRLTEPWRAFVGWARSEYGRRLAERRVLCFQDLLRRAARAVEESPLFAGAVRETYKAALIDEFQDTDPLQWQIFSRLFGDGEHHIYLIGDPKQAIYAFRGANLQVYTAAKAGQAPLNLERNYRSDARYLAALNAVLGRWGESLFGHPAIPYLPVDARERSPEDRLKPPASYGAAPWRDGRAAPLQLRFFGERPEEGDEGPVEPMGKTLARQLLPRLVAADVVALLDAEFQLWRPHDGAFGTLSPGDLAVLVRKNKDARAVARSLWDAGVPAVLAGAENVFSTEEAEYLLRWLQAVAKPTDDGRARAAAVSPLFGWRAPELLALDAAEGQDGRWDRWLSQLATYRNLVEARGLQQTFRRAIGDCGVYTRLLALPDGDRRLTNLFHLLELGHAVQLNQRLRLDGMIRWLSEQRCRADQEADELLLRLERDDEAVKVLTMHKSKGLQYPVVFAPYLWDEMLPGKRDEGKLVHPRQAGAIERRLDLQRGPATAEHQRNLELAAAERAQENMRLLYVALTRALHRCVVYDGPVSDQRSGARAGGSALAALLHCQAPVDDDDPGEVRYARTVERVGELAPAELWADLQAWAARTRLGGGEPLVGVSAAPLPVPPPGEKSADTTTAPGKTEVQGDGAATENGEDKGDRLAARTWQRASRPGGSHQPDPRRRGLDHTWQRLSYTSITNTRRRGGDDRAEAGSAAGRQGQAVVEEERRQENADPSRGADPGQRLRERLRAARPEVPEDQPPVPLAGFPSGPDAGSFIHALFEHLDFAQFPRDPGDTAGMERGRAALAGLLRDQGTLHGMRGRAVHEPLLAHLPAVLQTPLGGELGDLRLADIPASRRLDELPFHLPMLDGGLDLGAAAGGPAPRRVVPGKAFGEAFSLAEGHDDLRTEYLRELAEGWINHRFAGFLTGTLDLVFATPLEDAPQRFYVVDYKSNRLNLLGEERLYPQNFCRAWMLHEMERHAYLVQLHLYTVALQRFLRHRLGPDTYRYEDHVGGAYYLFMRGMTGPDTPRDGDHPLGVFYHRPAQQVVDQLDALFSGAAPAEPAKGATR